MTIQFLFFTITITKRKPVVADVEKHRQREKSEKQMQDTIDRYRHMRQYL
ncbi:YrzI family small protein [Alkalihalobacterium elongatum]|nr:YrzI family small protein [Alkalihalobacterium elongatum]